MTQQTVSQTYLLGISEGRALLKLFQADGIADLDTFKAALSNSEELLKQGFAGNTHDCLRGERDFWRAKVKRLTQGD